MMKRIIAAKTGMEINATKESAIIVFKIELVAIILQVNAPLYNRVWPLG